MLKLKLQYFGYLMWRANWLEKTPDAGEDWRQEEKWIMEDEMVGCHHWLNGHDFEQTLGDSERQRSLECCNPGVTKIQTQLNEWATITKQELQRSQPFRHLFPQVTSLSWLRSGHVTHFWTTGWNTGDSLWYLRLEHKKPCKHLPKLLVRHAFFLLILPPRT